MHRDIALTSVISLDKNIVDFERKLDLTIGELVILDQKGNKQWMYAVDCLEHHSKLVDFINDLKELEAQQKISDDCLEVSLVDINSECTTN